MTRKHLRALVVFALLLSAGPLAAQQDPGSDAGDPAELSLERIFGSSEFRNERFGPARWLEGGEAYTTLEPAAADSGMDIVRYDAATGERTVLVAAARLLPPGGDAPLEIEDYQWSPDGSKLLVFTNSERVWRENTRGDYWVLDLASGSLMKLGGDAPESTLMFAKFSPEGDRVAYVRENNIYVEPLDGGASTQLTTDGSRTTINGTFDWVYEEELGLQDGWRWSPDGERIAYWQLDATGVRDFLLLNSTDSLYSFTVPVQYPKAGTTNSAGRVGVVSAEGGSTRWMDVPGDPRENYIARMEWAASSDEIVMQRLNRLQNTLEIMLGDAATGQVRTVYTERDSAWVDMRVELMEWLDDGSEFAWISESRRVASRLGDRPRRLLEAARHARGVRRHRRRGDRRGGRLALLHRLSRGSDAHVPFPFATRRRRGAGAGDAGRHERVARLRRGPRCGVGVPRAVLVRHAAHDRARAPARSPGPAGAGGEPGLSRQGRGARSRGGRVLPRRPGRRRDARRLDHEAPGLRSVTEVPACWSTSTASRGARPSRMRGAAARTCGISA